VRVEEIPDSGLIARQLAPCRMVICGAPSYFETDDVRRTPADLTAHNCFTLAGLWLSYFRAWHLTAADGTELKLLLSGNLRSNSWPVLKVAALTGHGLACLPTYLVGDALQSGRLVTVLNDYPLPQQTLLALYPHNRHLSAKVRASSTYWSRALSKSRHGTAGAELPAEQSVSLAPRPSETIGGSTKSWRFCPRTQADAP
jgi:DNA-binding transcriptional LysR family regulator